MADIPVKIVKIDEIRPHDNADSLEIVTVGGWQVVVRKGTLKPGDHQVYVPPGALVPKELSDKLGVTNYLANGRVRCAKLRGVPSFGFLFSDERSRDLPVDTDVKSIYGITKYCPPVVATEGDAETPHELLQRYTDIQNLRNYPTLLSGQTVSVSEKIDGSNVKIGWVDGVLMASSMGVRRKRPEPDQMTTNRYWYPYSTPGVRSLLDGLPEGLKLQYLVYGEVYGSRNQQGGSMQFRAFDILVMGHYMGVQEFQKVCADNGIPVAPVVYTGLFNLETIKALAEQPVSPDLSVEYKIREGLVVKTLEEQHHPEIGRMILKYHSDAYLFGVDSGKIKDVTDA